MFGSIGWSRRRKMTRIIREFQTHTHVLSDSNADFHSCVGETNEQLTEAECSRHEPRRTVFCVLGLRFEIPICLFVLLTFLDFFEHLIPCHWG